jgi:hypothetical protein
MSLAEKPIIKNSLFKKVIAHLIFKNKDGLLRIE